MKAPSRFKSAVELKVAMLELVSVNVPLAVVVMGPENTKLVPFKSMPKRVFVLSDPVKVVTPEEAS